MDPILFGVDDENKIIACNQISDNAVRVYKKIENRTIYEDRNFFPFFYISDISLLDGFDKQPRNKRELLGNGFYKYLCVFNSWSELKEAYYFIFDNFKKETHKNQKEFNCICFKNDPAAHYLLQFGKTLFKDIAFSDIKRMQIDFVINTNPKNNSKEFVAFYLTDNFGWKKKIDEKNKPENKKIEELISIIIEKDSDIIEGYDLYHEFIELLTKKCREYNIELNIGRDSLPLIKQDRFPKYDFELERSYIIIPGRHIINTINLISNFKHLKKNSNLDSLQKIYDILFQNDKTELKEDSTSHFYNCSLIEKIHSLLLPELYYMNQMISYNLSKLVMISHAAKIDSILYREYLKQRYSLPIQSKQKHITTINEIYYTGLLGPILSVTITNFYQNIIIQNEIPSEEEPLLVFKDSLKKLIEIRNTNSESDSPNSQFVNAINNIALGYFQYLNNPFVTFETKELTENVIKIAKEIIEKIIKYISFSGGIPVHVDHDEIIFVPPRDTTNEELEKYFIELLSKKISEVESICFKFRTRRVLSYKKRNLSFLLYNNKILIKSPLLFSKQPEKFARSFLLQAVDLILNNKLDELHQLYNLFYKNITEKKLDIADFSKTEVIKEPINEYTEKVKTGQKSKIPIYQLAIASGKNYKVNDKISYYYINESSSLKRLDVDTQTMQHMQKIAENVTDSKLDPKEIYSGCENIKLSEEWNSFNRDENIDYYVKRLNNLAEQLHIFFSEQDFNNIFSFDDLFSYTPKKAKVQTKKVDYFFEETL
jgi:DNA polymerase elongation subunit (family B)